MNNIHGTGEVIRDTSPSAAQVISVLSSVYGIIRAWRTFLEWPDWNSNLTSPVSQSHSITILSSEPVTIMLPSALKLKAFTQPRCFSSFRWIPRRRTRSCPQRMRFSTEPEILTRVLFSLAKMKVWAFMWLFAWPYPHLGQTLAEGGGWGLSRCSLCYASEGSSYWWWRLITNPYGTIAKLLASK